MTDEELISTLWSGEVTLSTVAAAAVRIKELLRDLKSVLEREAETQVRHEAREDAIREAALREALKVIDEWVYCADVEPEILALIGEKE